jgi:hypothetical protein
VVLVAAALLAAMCQQPATPLPEPTPDRVPDPVPYPDPDDDGTQAPSSPCEEAYEHLGELECPPAEGHAWLAICDSLNSSALSCLLATDTCAVARACLEH